MAYLLADRSHQPRAPSEHSIAAQEDGRKRIARRLQDDTIQAHAT